MTAINLDTSFTAQLDCLNWGTSIKPVMIIESAFMDMADSGWLCLPESFDTVNTTPVTLRFDFIERRDNRRHYRVTCVTEGSHYFGRQMDSSLNRFLGFYRSVSDDVFWKIEEIGVHGEGENARPAFILRDRLGYTVKIKTHGPGLSLIAYLSTHSVTSDEVHFTLADYKPL
ncbi:hypothetical protein C1X72_10530 [Pseudomonas sp. FW306-2-2C-D06B]|jgi:hypothetical protein|nr:hypothetical protein O162_12040 [Pseudomonas putida SJ3]PMY81262.1 hypothetical protein C1X72_10530 [Pseudomonas sp. FW306-2-2C-D06B]PNA98031.1 hypothetical protein C1X74_13055 [Pseudomonas sp. GW460-5]PNB58728.1 hypothetical protein C1X73_13295 [Pseudomonas sp. FW305-130]QDY35256.1 hypothetical protein CHR26_02925 [Pseudomonas putida]